MRNVEAESLRKHILKEVYGELPFRIISGGMGIGVVLSPSEYNRLRLIEYIEIERRKDGKKIGEFVDKVLWHNRDKSPTE